MIYLLISLNKNAQVSSAPTGDVVEICHDTAYACLAVNDSIVISFNTTEGVINVIARIHNITLIQHQDVNKVIVDEPVTSSSVTTTTERVRNNKRTVTATQMASDYARSLKQHLTSMEENLHGSMNILNNVLTRTFTYDGFVVECNYDPNYDLESNTHNYIIDCVGRETMRLTTESAEDGESIPGGIFDTLPNTRSRFS